MSIHQIITYVLMEFESQTQSLMHKVLNTESQTQTITACIPLTNDRKTFTTIHRPKTICHKHNL